MQNALIFSPSFDGHRQVHVFVMSQILEELGFNIFIAGNTREKVSNSFYIDKLKNKPAINILDTSGYTGGGTDITIVEFLNLQNVCKADLTIFAEADNHIDLFTSQIFKTNGRLKGRVVGSFLRPFYYYRKTPFIDKLRFLKHFPSRWNKDPKLFYKFFLKRFSLLDVSLSIDENFASHHPKFTWIPDVFQQYAEVIIKADKKYVQGEWIEKLKIFKEKNKERFPFLYFGTAQYRRGYDTLLKLAEQTGGCFIHCGLRDQDATFSHDVNKIISSLKSEDRFFETNEYIQDPSCIEYFFKSVSHLILPYRGCFGSSGVMSQALEYGIPILAPNVGIMSYLIEKYNLGITYSDSDINSLKSQLQRFKSMDPKLFQDDIKAYMHLQSVEKLKNVLVNSFVSAPKKSTRAIGEA
jgi:glycosyltransferase involved in cell wall biosynthesis